MLTLRLPRFFAFSFRMPAVPFPVRGDASPLLKLVGRAPKKRKAWVKRVRKFRPNPVNGAYAMKISGRAGAGRGIGLRRAMFRGQS